MTTGVVVNRKLDLFELDLPEERFKHYLKKNLIAVDTETLGLNIKRDRLCLVQIADEDGVVSLVRYKQKILPGFSKSANLKYLLEAPNVLKLFHFARFDIAVLKHYLDCDVKPIWCTKIASKLVRTYSDRHGLKDLSKELLNQEVDKTNQMSDWANENLTDSQLEYAANDVRVLIPIYNKLSSLLRREGRTELAERSFKVLPIITELDANGFRDLFEH